MRSWWCRATNSSSLSPPWVKQRQGPVSQSFLLRRIFLFKKSDEKIYAGRNSETWTKRIICASELKCFLSAFAFIFCCLPSDSAKDKWRLREIVSEMSDLNEQLEKVHVTTRPRGLFLFNNFNIPESWLRSRKRQGRDRLCFCQWIDTLVGICVRWQPRWTCLVCHFNLLQNLRSSASILHHYVTLQAWKCTALSLEWKADPLKTFCARIINMFYTLLEKANRATLE